MQPFFANNAERLNQFPVARERIFLAHAAVTALPAIAAQAMMDHVQAGSENHQEAGNVMKDVSRIRQEAAAFLDVRAEEIALLGPTALGLGLFANGITWKSGDEILCYQDDYPSNVYPWINLTQFGVKIRFLKPDIPGRITPELVAAALTPQTKLAALASCHFLTGWRIDIDAIGQLLRDKGILFSLDAIQTLGAFPTSTRYVDFLSAGAHKWLLGPLSIGVVYVRKERFSECRPTFLGACNVNSPNFITQDTISFPETACRYEPGALNVIGIYGIGASIRMLSQHGIPAISAAILNVRDDLQGCLEEMGFEFLSPSCNEPLRSGILTCRHPRLSSQKLFQALESKSIIASLRNDRSGNAWLRFSPHFYNTHEEMDRVVDIVTQQLTAIAKKL